LPMVSIWVVLQFRCSITVISAARRRWPSTSGGWPVCRSPVWVCGGFVCRPVRGSR
jgi:hypothetical protein